MAEKKKKKGLIIGIIVGVIVLILSIVVSFDAGVDSVKTEIDGTKKDYNELVDMYNSTLKDLKKEDAKLEKKKDEVQEAVALVEQKDELVEKISSTKEESSALDDELKSKEDQLSKIEKGIKEKEDDPVQLSAGEYIIGKDFPEGRYKATNVGRGTNLQVFDSDGSAIVNTILGGGTIGRGDYVFFATENTLLKTAGSIKLIPVE